MTDDVHAHNQLLQAYKNALYVARLPHAVVELRVGTSNPVLGEWMERNGYTSAALLTAFNPRSEILSLHENESRQAQLLMDIAQLGYTAFDGYGADDGGDWPHEASVLVMGITREQAMRLAEKFQQNAFLFVSRGDEVQLCLAEYFANQAEADWRQT